MSRKINLARKGEKYKRMAYDFEYEASVFRAGGFDIEAGTLNDFARMCGRFGDRLLDKAGA